MHYSILVEIFGVFIHDSLSKTFFFPIFASLILLPDQLERLVLRNTLVMAL